MTHSARATPALRAMVEADPALAALSLWCGHRDGPRTETHGDTVIYGPDFERLALHEQVGLAAHHVLHVALRHGARLQALGERLGDGFNPDLWRICTDAIVNEVLLEAGQALPRPALRLSELLSETLGAAASPREALAAWDADRLYLALINAGAAGRAASYAARQHFVPDLAPGQQGEEAGRGEDESAWRQHLARAMEAGRIAGVGVGRLAPLLADLPKPRTPWEVVLRGLLTRALLPAPRESYGRPARTWLAMDAEASATGIPAPGFLPGRERGTPVPRIVIGLDTSSSIGPVQARLFLAEIGGIARRTGAEVYVLPFDEAPDVVIRLDPSDPTLPKREVRQGGGTDFRPMLTAAALLSPSVIVVLTDLDGPVGDPPKVPVLWATPGPAVPPFGKHLDLSQ